MENPTIFFYHVFNSPCPSHMFVFAPTFRPLYNIIGPIALTFSAACDAATVFSDNHGRCCCVYVCVLLYVESSVRGVCAVVGTRRSGTAACFFLLQKQPLSLAATKSVYSSSAAAIQRQPCARSSRLCASSHGGVCACVWLVHSSRISNHDNMNTSNATIVKNTSSDLMPSIRSIQQRQEQHSM